MTFRHARRPGSNVPKVFLRDRERYIRYVIYNDMLYITAVLLSDYVMVFCEKAGHLRFLNVCSLSFPLCILIGPCNREH